MFSCRVSAKPVPVPISFFCDSPSVLVYINQCSCFDESPHAAATRYMALPRSRAVFPSSDQLQDGRFYHSSEFREDQRLALAFHEVSIWIMTSPLQLWHTFRIALIVSSPSSSIRYPRFLSPTPCSPVTVPSISIARLHIRWTTSSAVCFSASLYSRMAIWGQ